jgi:hypothetical protein
MEIGLRSPFPAKSLSELELLNAVKMAARKAA